LRKYGIILLLASIALPVLAGWLWLNLFSPSGSSDKSLPHQKIDASLFENLSSIVSAYRKIIVLIEDEGSLDARGIQEILVRKYRFKPECILTLTNEEATREKILSVLGDIMGDPTPKFL